MAGFCKIEITESSCELKELLSMTKTEEKSYQRHRRGLYGREETS
jgi:hypothetical protein